MGLTWRDGIATLLVALAGLITISIAAGWNWPLLQDALAGGIAVGVVGFVACVVGGGPNLAVDALKRGHLNGIEMTFAVVGSTLAIGATGLLVGAIVLNSLALLVWATIVLGVLWLVTTGHHAFTLAAQPVRAV